ncbi:MAG: amidohydrolase family protein [Flavobacteriales bacterium]|nr:amidohydrolase family protein [Flavobacteriales bacterium]
MRKFLFVLGVLFTLPIFSQSWKPINGSKDSRNHYTAFTHANIFIKAGQTLENATLLIKNDKIIALGTSIEIPLNTIQIDLEGAFVYPSFIELNSQYGLAVAKKAPRNRKPQIETKKQPGFYWNEAIKPEVKTADLIQAKEEEAKKYRKMGFGTVLSHLKDGIIRGTSSLVPLTESKDFRLLLPEAASHYSFSKGNSRQSYPSSMMGIIALIRQVHFDAAWYAENENSVKYNRSIAALNSIQALPKIFDTPNTLSMLRADKIGDEFNFQFILKGNGTEYQRIQEIKATEASVIVPVNFPKAYDVSDPFEAQRLSLAQMKAWELAGENLKELQNAAIEFAISSDGLKTEKEWFANIEVAISKGLKRENAIKALTETPAKLIGAGSLVGTLEKGKLANFIISSDTLFTKKSKIYSNWILGKEFKQEEKARIDFEGFYSLNVNKRKQFDVKLSKTEKAFSAKVAEKNSEEFQKAKFSAEGNRVNLSFTIDKKAYRLSGSVSDHQSRIWTGKTIVNGKWVDWAAIRKTKEKLADTTKQDSATNAAQEIAYTAPVLYPNMAYGWDSIPSKAETILFKNATIWTNEEEGILKKSDVLVKDGKIEMVGYKINMEVMFPKLEGGFREVDATDLHITSGIIDEHSHIAIEQGVNESGQSVTAEVSIADVVDSDDINIYRQLSGGVTSSQLLHGSANPIGGQSALIKLRWGQSPEKMKIEGADGFIKFALGENVKQSNWGDMNTIRFPQTRMGVEQVFYDAFVRAREYKDEWKIFNAKNKREQQKAFAPRFDIELEVLGQILDSQRFVTCHSYIQSEINMLIHVADSMGFRINTFTHILEGYKVADKLKAHGAAGSTFSDWWAYKFEVNDAIPYNGSIMHKLGVLTGFNSDDAEMGRRLNQEAAKAVKYGGLSEEEAWKFVTLNPAKMLHLDDRIGSIKAGKDADLVLWTDNPLSIYAKVKQTYIDGIPYFDAERDVAMREQVILERERIITKMLKEKASGKATQKVEKEKKVLYECDTIEE